MDGENGTAIAASESMQKYFQQLQKDIDHCYALSNEARKKGLDPALHVEIPQARDLAQRVEELVGPKNIAPKIREVTKKIGNRELVSLELARYIVKGDNYQFSSTEEALDQAIRTGLAILTEGVLVAPLEGIADVKLGTNNDGSIYVDLFFSGPIRSAGGTGQAMSVLIADVVRRDLGIDAYIPTKNEIERYKEEIPLYKRVQHLQYTPTVDEIDLIVSKCPICIDGEGTEREEITGNRDLPRVETNRLRGGACLVIAEGLCLKAPKLMKHISKLKLEGWDFLDIFVNKNKKDANDENETEEKNCIPAILPSTKYIKEVIAGRPVFSHPSRKGGFRLRYGRARTAGLASTAIHPSTMVLFNEFIAIGTQMKMERPGKATIGTPCSTIEPPIVLTYGDDLIELPDPNVIDYTAVKEIIDAGEILIPFGEFLENNAILPNASFSYEWWIQELQEKLGILPEKNTADAVKKADEQTHQQIKEKFNEDINLIVPTFQQAQNISTTYKISLHPYYTLFWHDITPDEVKHLASYLLENGTYKDDTLLLPHEKEVKKILVNLGVLHQKQDDTLIIEKHAQALPFCLGLQKEDTSLTPTTTHQILETIDQTPVPSTVHLISQLSGITIQEKAPFRIGTRMGRPEKAAERKMRPPPHVLFPLGNYGSNQRLFSKAADHSTIEVEAGKRECNKCGNTTYRLTCNCGGHTTPFEERIETFGINIAEELNHGKKHLKLRTIPDSIKGVQGTISKHKTPEPVEKGILRAKHSVSVFKDGTIRFDMTDAPLTHFKPYELHVSVDRLKHLGYETDIQNDPLTKEDQICELKVQDVIISQSCAEYFMKTAQFIDELLVRFYKMKPFYSIKKIEDLTGHLVIGLAPHTSGGSLGRIIGFTDALVCFSHPFYHAAKRRNCYHGSQQVFLSDKKNNKTITSPIETFVKKYSKDIEPKIIDSFGTLKYDISASSDLFSFALNRSSGKLEKRKVTCLIKGTTNSWIAIKTSTNREIKVTPDHNVMVITDRGVKTKKAKDIEEGDQIPLATHIPYESDCIKQINLAKTLTLLDDEILINIKLRNSQDFFKFIVKKIGREKIITICGIEGTWKKSLSKWYKSVPLLHFKKICENSSFTYDDLPKKTKLGFRRDHVNIPVYINDINSLFWILGMYCAEGWSRSNNSSHQINFRICNSTLINHLNKKMSKVFSIKPYINGTQLYFCSKLLYILFTKIWCAGSKAYDKKVPDIIYAGDKDSIKQFISAFFDGDGSISLNPDRVAFYSVSKTLLEGISTLLLKENIFTRYHQTKKRLPGKRVLERYKELKKKPVRHILNHLVLTGVDKYTFAAYVKPVFPKKLNRIMEMEQKKPESSRRLLKYEMRYHPVISYSDYTFDFVTKIERTYNTNEPCYCLDIEGDNLEDKAIYWHNQLIQIRCDGDEDGLMLLMDALLNFSHEYIPDKRGGKMDLPLILTTRLDPSEVDKEAHNVDCLARYPLEFYLATLRHEHPKNLEDKMDVVSSRLGTPLQYENFGFTHDTFDISQGPSMSRYKTLKTMMDKMNAQLNLAAKIRAVDEADVAYKVIERHFLPDILGNLRAFSKQSVRCPTCNITYRRIPLSGVCRDCGGKLILTVHEKSVKKYLEISKEIADRYHIPWYAHQRINLVEKNIDSLFSSDKVRKTKLTDFF